MHPKCKAESELTAKRMKLEESHSESEWTCSPLHWNVECANYWLIREFQSFAWFDVWNLKQKVSFLKISEIPNLSSRIYELPMLTTTTGKWQIELYTSSLAYWTSSFLLQQILITFLCFIWKFQYSNSKWLKTVCRKTNDEFPLHVGINFKSLVLFFFVFIVFFLSLFSRCI